jgi:hypothetical protein
MERALLSHLQAWQQDAVHLPLIIRGTRQVGKTYVVEHFAQRFCPDYLTINFEKDPGFIACFDSFYPQDILNSIYLKTGKAITPGKTLLFLDEIQECPNAITALRYFKEDMPALHVIGAGSLLEFALNDEALSMPVGRAQYLYLKPLSFVEFLQAGDQKHLIQHLHEATIKSGVNPVAHQQLTKLLREYFLLGGLPAVLQEYWRTRDFSKVHALQHSIFSFYRDDFGKYAAKTKHTYMRRLLEKSPALIGEHFKYSRIDPDALSRDLKLALDYLVRAGLIYKIHQSNASGLPINAFMNEKKFKLLMLDIGLIQAMSLLSADVLLNEDLMLANQGALAEQFVGQELLAYQPPYMENQLYYWDRDKKSSTAEVDYVINVGEDIIPIEVKSGKTGSLRSLQLFLNEKDARLGVRLSLKPLSFENRVLSVPLYMISELPRLIREVLSKDY